MHARAQGWLTSGASVTHRYSQNPLGPAQLTAPRVSPRAPASRPLLAADRDPAWTSVGPRPRISPQLHCSLPSVGGRRGVETFASSVWWPPTFSPCAEDSDPATSTESTGRQAGAQASCLPVPLESPLPSSALNEALAVKTRGNELPRPRPGPRQTRGACLAPPRAARVHFHPSVLCLNSGPLFTGPLTGATRVLTALHPEPAGLGPTPALAHLG